MQETGKIKIGEKNYKVFLEEIVGTTPVETIPLPIVVENTNSGVTVKAESINNKEERFFRISGPIKGLAYGNKPDDFGVFYGGVFVQKLCVWEVILLLNNNAKIKVKLNWNGDFQLTGDNNVIIEGTTEVVEPVTSPVVDQTQVDVSVPNPSKYQRESAKLGEWYQSGEKFRLLPCSHGDYPANYYYKLESDALVYENFGQRMKMPSDRDKDKQGDHPEENQQALANGNYKITVKNRLDENVIYGVVTKTQYDQYNPGGLILADWWVRLKKGESASQSFDWSEKCNKDALIIGGYSKKPCLSITRPFYRDGIIYIEEMRIEGSPNGAEVSQEGSTTLKYYSAIEPNINITIEYQGGGVGQPAKYRVVEKNGLEVDPNTFMVTPWNTSYVKFFCHKESSFENIPDNQI